MKIINRPKCAKCKENTAFTYVAGIWLCGNCYGKFLMKQMKEKQKVLLEE